MKSLPLALLLALAGCCTGFQPGAKTERFFWPVTGTIYQGFYGNEVSGEWPGFYFDEHDQERFFSGSGRMHRGIDVAAPAGAEVVAAREGIARRYDWNGSDSDSYGNRVVIDHGGRYWTLYAHLSKIAITDGQRVAEGDKVGEVGSTGKSTGPHLHFEIRHSADPSHLLSPHYIPGGRGDAVRQRSVIHYVYPKEK